MSLKQEIETWVAALAAYDSQEFDNALKCFETIADTSKILFNCGVIHATLGQHQEAIECYRRAVHLDQYLAIAYFQQGVSNFLMGDFEEALANFNDTLLYLRGNNNINYDQLGLKFKLYSCEVLFNRGLCYIYLQQLDPGMQDLLYATREKMVKDHDVIDEAIKDRAEGYTVFSIPVGVVYRPSEAKVKNLPTKDYLGKARLVAEQRDFISRGSALGAMSLDDRPGEKLSYAATHLVRTDLRSRTRQQSEPPLHRNMFPPTPPPELERVAAAEAYHRRRQSNDSTSSGTTRSSLQNARPAAKPLRLELGVAAFEQKSQQQQQHPQQQQQQPLPPQISLPQQQPQNQQRLGTKRSESERPSYRNEYGSGSQWKSDSSSRRKDPRFAQVPVIEEDPIAAYSDQVVQQQQQNQHEHQLRSPPTNRSRSSAPRGQPMPIEEGNEDDEDDDEQHDSFDNDYDDDDHSSNSQPLAFEIIPPNKKSSSHHSITSNDTAGSSSTHSYGQARHRSRSRRPPPPPEVKKVRVKVHGGEDMRYVLVPLPETDFPALEQIIRVKFGLGANAFKLKIRDEEGDMVTMGDQDDWEMYLGVVRAAANRERGEMGKGEMWVQEL